MGTNVLLLCGYDRMLYTSAAVWPINYWGGGSQKEIEGGWKENYAISGAVYSQCKKSEMVTLQEWKS